MLEVLRRNWGYKLVSVFLAVLLWLYVSNTLVGAENSTATSLQVKGLPNNLVVTSKLPTTVSVKLQGASSGAAKDLVAYVDLSNGTKGERSYPVIVAAPPDMKVLSVEPANVTISLDELKERTFPVTVNTLGTVAAGYDAGKPVVRPATVTVLGPERTLAQINQVFVEVNLANATDTIQVYPVVRFKDSGGNPILGPDVPRPIITSQPQNVSVIVPVMKKGLASRSVPIKVTTTGTPGPGFVVDGVMAIPDVVKIYGPMDALKGIDYLNGGTIDVSGATQDITNQIKPENLGLPAGVSLEQGTEISVIAHLTPAPIQRTLSSLPVSVVNLPSGQQADLSAKALDVVIKGPPDVVNGLNPAGFTLSADASGISPGQSKDVVPFFTQPLPAGVDVINIPKVSITVKQQ